MRSARSDGLKTVSFEDPVPKESVYDVLCEADAFVVNVRDEPLYRYGVSFNKFYDYLAMTRPTLIGMRGPWNPFQDSGAGLTVTPDSPAALASGARQLANLSFEVRQSMGDRGRTFVESHHDNRQLARDLEGVLARAVANGVR